MLEFGSDIPTPQDVRGKQIVHEITSSDLGPELSFRFVTEDDKTAEPVEPTNLRIRSEWVRAEEAKTTTDVPVLA